jgi:hypothetical protein
MLFVATPRRAFTRFRDLPDFVAMIMIVLIDGNVIESRESATPSCLYQMRDIANFQRGDFGVQVEYSN